MTKLLVIGDQGEPTGFERVIRGITTHLHETGKYDIVARGLNYREGKSSITYPYTVKPIESEPDDLLGVTKLTEWLEEDKPDALLIVQDLWNQNHYLQHKPKEMASVGYFPVDAPNMKWSYTPACGAHSQIAAYTEFGARETAAGIQELFDLVMAPQADAQAAWGAMRRDGLSLEFRIDRMAKLQQPKNWNIVAHGSEARFTPMDKAWCRAQFGLDQDAFIVLSVNSNQFRKRQDLTMRAFVELLKVRQDALLVFHCFGENRNGWDLVQLAWYYGIQNNVVFMHHLNPNLTDEQLGWLYNTADVHINTGGGEGWGLSSTESAQCGIPQLVPDWSATREIWKDYGVLLPVSDWRHEVHFLNTAHAIVDPKAAGQWLIRLADDRELRDHYGQLALQRASMLPTWPQVGAAFDVMLERALNEPEPEYMSYPQVLAERTEHVKSEVSGRVCLDD